MNESCRKCKHSKPARYDKNWKVERWYCKQFKETIADFILIINCPGFEPNESNLHVNNAARPSPQTRDKGIHQEE